PSEIMIWQPEFTDKILSRKPGAVHILSLLKATALSLMRMVCGTLQKYGKSSDYLTISYPLSGAAR
ncbi:hypothetical protein, partial [Escherichia coli]|uniref:hypothetical protein n=1 Tax=Escherichia coli TaxID=562 RepID=UPI000906EE27